MTKRKGEPPQLAAARARRAAAQQLPTPEENARAMLVVVERLADDILTLRAVLQLEVSRGAG